MLQFGEFCWRPGLPLSPGSGCAEFLKIRFSFAGRSSTLALGSVRCSLAAGLKNLLTLSKIILPGTPDFILRLVVLQCTSHLSID